MTGAVERGVGALAMRQLTDGVHRRDRRAVDGAGRAELARQRAPLRQGIDGDDARAHRRGQLGGRQPDGALAEDRQRVAARDIQAFERRIRRAGATRDGRAFGEGQLVRQRHQ